MIELYQLVKIEKVIGLTNYELGGKIMKKFVAFIPKPYSYLTDKGNNAKKAKETKKWLTEKILKTCVDYFSLFLKEQYVFWLFQTKYFEIKFNLQLLYLPNISQAFILF